MKLHKKGIVVGAIGGIATIAGAVILTINSKKIGFDNGWDCCLGTLKQIDPQAYEDFCDTVHFTS